MGTTLVVSIFYSMPPLYTKSYNPRLLDIMNTKEIEKAINHITTLQVRLCHSENNLQYIKRLQALRHWLNTLDTLLDKQGSHRVSMRQLIRATSNHVVGSHSTTGFTIPS